MTLLGLIGCAGIPNDLDRPNRLALGPDGTLFVSDFHHDRIVEFDPQGRFVRTFGKRGIGFGDLWRVNAMAVTPEGDLVVANRRPDSEDAASQSFRFEIVWFRDGEQIDRIALDGSTLQPEGWVDAIAPAPSGDLVLADTTNGELIEVDRRGLRLGRFGGIPRIDAVPSGLRRGGDDVWVVEQYRHRVSRIPREGSAEVLTLDDQHHGLPRFPSAVGVCPGKWVGIADLAGHRVQRYDLTGRWLADIEPDPVDADSPVELLDFDVSADCSRMYLVDSKGNRVLVTDPDGKVLQILDRW